MSSMSTLSAPSRSHAPRVTPQIVGPRWPKSTPRTVRGLPLGPSPPSGLCKPPRPVLHQTTSHPMRWGPGCVPAEWLGRIPWPGHASVTEQWAMRGGLSNDILWRPRWAVRGSCFTWAPLCCAVAVRRHQRFRTHARTEHVRPTTRDTHDTRRHERYSRPINTRAMQMQHAEKGVNHTETRTHARGRTRTEAQRTPAAAKWEQSRRAEEQENGSAGGKQLSGRAKSVLN